MTQLAERAEMESMETETSALATTEGVKDIAPLDYHYEKISLTPELVRKYICKGGTNEDIFMFMGTCRALNLDPLKREVWFIKFPGEPGQTVVGYRKYLDVAYRNGLENIEYEFDDEDDPKKCTITLEIKGRAKPFIWETWLEDVIKRKKDGKPNVFWTTMLRDMFRKCAITRAIRYAGLDTESLPYIPEEIGPSALQMPQYTALPEPQATPEPAEVESVTDATEIDLTPLRETYFGMIEGIFANPDDRHSWQLQNTGKASVTEWGPAEYSKAFKAVSQMAGPRIREPESSSEGEPVDGMTEAAENKEAEEQAAAEKAQETETPEAETPYTDEDEPLEQQVEALLKKAQEEGHNLTREFADLCADTFSSVEARDRWTTQYIKSPSMSWGDADYAKGVLLLRKPPLKDDKPDLEITDDGTPVNPGETEPPDEELISKEQIAKLRAFSIQLPNYKNMGSIAFRLRVKGIIGHSYKRLGDLTQSEAQDVINELQAELAEHLKPVIPQKEETAHQRELAGITADTTE